MRFPALAKLARDLFAARASSVASESAFSLAERLVDPTRTKLSDESIKSLKLLQSLQRYFRNNRFKKTHTGVACIHGLWFGHGLVMFLFVGFCLVTVSKFSNRFEP